MIKMAIEKLGFKIEKATEKEVKISRKTRESVIKVSIDSKPRREFKINTGLAFFNHMIETIAWRLGMNIDVSVKTTNYKLMHVITEDTGLVLGKALKILLEKRMKKGTEASGFAVLGIDEALALAAISVEGRRNCFIDLKNKKINMKKAEDTLGYDLSEFINGLAQGMATTIHIKVLSGENPHHLWESVFRALGRALKDVFEANPWRKGTISGVKGILE